MVMETWLTSTFFQAIATAIAHSFWQVGLLVLLNRILTTLLPTKAATTYRIAAIGALLGLLLFTGTCIAALFNAGIVNPAGWWITNWHFEKGQPMMAAVSGIVIPIVSVAYLLTVIFLALRLYRGFAELQQWIHPNIATKASLECRLFVDKYSKILGIATKVQVFYSKRVRSPLTIGFLKPIILLPLASINHLSLAQTEAILLHELAHIQRHDYLFNIFFQIAEVLLFFNPFMHILLRNAYAEREHCCDDLVLQFKYNAREYATALLSIEQESRAGILALGAASQVRFQLLHRIGRIMSANVKSHPHHSLSISLVLGILFALVLTVWNASIFEKGNIERQPSVLQQNQGSTIDNLPMLVQNSMMWLEKEVPNHNLTPIGTVKKLAPLATNSNNITAPKMRSPAKGNSGNTWDEIAPQLARLISYQALQIAADNKRLQMAAAANQNAGNTMVSWTSVEGEFFDFVEELELAAFSADSSIALPPNMPAPTSFSNTYLPPVYHSQQTDQAFGNASDNGLKIAMAIQEKDEEELSKALRQILTTLPHKTPGQLRKIFADQTGNDTLKLHIKKRVIIQL